MKLERRYIPGSVKLEQRADDPNGLPSINGYAIVYNSLSQNLGGPGWEWFEECAPGLANDSIQDRSRDIVGLFNHDPSQILASRIGGTMQVGTDDLGVWYKINPNPDMPIARGLIKAIERGDIRGSSFAFDVLTEKWDLRDGKEIRTLVKINLFDVSPVTYPAYDGTNGLVAVRMSFDSRDKNAADYEQLFKARKREESAPLLVPVSVRQRALDLRSKKLGGNK